MNAIQSTLLDILPAKRKSTPSGWTSFNAVCCHNNGHTRDTRRRGGILILPDGGFNYHCFNCNFKAGWQPGKLLSSNSRKLLNWLGLSLTDVGKLNLIALKIKDQRPNSEIILPEQTFKEIALPDDSKSFVDWIESGNQDIDLLNVIDYVIDQRSMKLHWYNWHWSPSAGFRDRVILPFYYRGKIVGYTARKITNQRPKYLTESQSGYVFNIDSQLDDRKFVIVTEGQFDAIAVDGVAIMTNVPNDQQINRINQLNRQVICVPDRDRAGADMLTAAIKQGWSVSLPPWNEQIKDVADAVKRYGRLYTLVTILHYQVQGEIKIQLLKKKLESNHA